MFDCLSKICFHRETERRNGKYSLSILSKLLLAMNIAMITMIRCQKELGSEIFIRKLLINEASIWTDYNRSYTLSSALDYNGERAREIPLSYLE